MKLAFVSGEYFYLLMLLLLLFIKRKSFRDYKSRFSAHMFAKIFPNTVQKRYSYSLFVVSYIALVVALARPVWYESAGAQKRVKSFLVGLDLSRSMLAKDIYPSRLEFAKKKLSLLLDKLEDTRVGILGFAREPYLIAPISDDYTALRTILEHLHTTTVDTKGSNIFALLQQANIFLNGKNQKAVLLFTDGGERKNFQKSIEFARKNGIKVFVYAIGTAKGGVIKEKGTLLKNKQGDIVVTRINSAIKTLCKQTGGEYFRYSLKANDIDSVARSVNRTLDKEEVYREDFQKRKELFYIPLLLAVVAFFLGVVGIKRRSV